jgi:hypothetical protein
MFKTVDLLNRVKAAYCLESDYATAKKLGITKQAMSRYMNKGYILDDKVAVTVAELLDLEPLQILACMHVERAERKEDTKLISFWMRYA